MEPAHRRMIREKLAKLLRLPLERVVSGARLSELTSSNVGLVFAIQEEFGILLAPEDMRTIQTVHQLIDAVALEVRAKKRRKG